MSSAGPSISTNTVSPFHQTLNLTVPGEPDIPITIDDISLYAQYGIRVCINYGSQVGASLVLLVILLILTRAEKRWTTVFTLNALSLMLNTIRNILQCIYFTGQFYDPYAYFSGDFSMVPTTQIATSVSSVLIETILVITVEASLVLQVRVVCITMTKPYRVGLTVVSLAVALATIAFRMALMVQNCRAIVNIETFYNYQWLAAGSLYIITGSICFFSAIFVTKLAIALRQRRKLGLRQFGPMQIIFTMGCQTLFIPAIFSVLEYVSTVPELGSQVLTLVVIFLPLSAMWAAQTVNGSTSNSNINSSARRGLLARWSKSRSNKLSSRGKTTEASSTPATTEEPDTPRFSMIRKDTDDDNVALKIHQTRSVDISQEKRVIDV